MTLSVDTLLVVSLMMAVFAAVSTVGTSLFLGAGFERLRAGFETVKKQTAFFSEQIHKLDGRVDSVEKQSSYFFEAITKLEQDAVAPEPVSNDVRPIIEDKLIQARKDDALNVDLLTATGFLNAPAINAPVQRSLSEQFAHEAEQHAERPHFH